MPNRILRESILDSDAVNKLSTEAEVFYRRLMSVVDDYGLFDARPRVLRSRLFPLGAEHLTDGRITELLGEIGKFGLIELYTVEGKEFLYFKKIGHARAKASKYPPPKDHPAFELLSKANAESEREASARSCSRTRPYSYSGSYSGSGSGSEEQIADPPKPAVGGRQPRPPRKKKPAGEDGERKPRPRDPLFDAIAACCGIPLDGLTRANGGLIAKVRKGLAEAGYTPEDVRSFEAKRYQHLPWTAQDRRRPTPVELEKNIHKARPPARPAAPAVDPFTFDLKPREGTDGPG